MAEFMCCDLCGGVVARDHAPTRIIRVYQKDGNARSTTLHICDECDEEFGKFRIARMAKKEEKKKNGRIEDR